MKSIWGHTITKKNKITTFKVREIKAYSKIIIHRQNIYFT